MLPHWRPMVSATVMSGREAVLEVALAILPFPVEVDIGEGHDGDDVGVGHVDDVGEDRAALLVEEHRRALHQVAHGPKPHAGVDPALVVYPGAAGHGVVVGGQVEVVPVDAVEAGHHLLVVPQPGVLEARTGQTRRRVRPRWSAPGTGTAPIRPGRPATRPSGSPGRAGWCTASRATPRSASCRRRCSCRR